MMTATADYLTMTILPSVLRRLSEVMEEEETSSLHSSSSESNNSIDVKTKEQSPKLEESHFFAEVRMDEDEDVQDVILNF